MPGSVLSISLLLFFPTVHLRYQTITFSISEIRMLVFRSINLSCLGSYTQSVKCLPFPCFWSQCYINELHKEYAQLIQSIQIDLLKKF